MRDLDTIPGTNPFERGPDGGAWAVIFRGQELLVVASYGMGWDHVSVSLKHRTPNWAEMAHVKRLFFEDHETAMQLHVPVDQHINCHPYCLHLWRPQNAPIPLPDPIMIGPVKDDAAANTIRHIERLEAEIERLKLEIERLKTEKQDRDLGPKTRSEDTLTAQR